jgi:hypothetical protein
MDCMDQAARRLDGCSYDPPVYATIFLMRSYARENNKFWPFFVPVAHRSASRAPQGRHRAVMPDRLVPADAGDTEWTWPTWRDDGDDPANLTPRHNHGAAISHYNIIA